MATDTLSFAELFKQKKTELVNMPLLPGTTTVISATRHSGKDGLMLESLIATLGNINNQNVVYMDGENSAGLILAYLSRKDDSGIDPFMSSENQNDVILSLVGNNNLYLQDGGTGLPVSGFIRNDLRNKNASEVDYFFLANVSSEEVKQLQTDNPSAVFVINELNAAVKGQLIELSSYTH